MMDTKNKIIFFFLFGMFLLGAGGLLYVASIGVLIPAYKNIFPERDCDYNYQIECDYGRDCVFTPDDRRIIGWLPNQNDLKICILDSNSEEHQYTIILGQDSLEIDEIKFGEWGERKAFFISEKGNYYFKESGGKLDQFGFRVM